MRIQTDKQPDAQAGQTTDTQTDRQKMRCMIIDTDRQTGRQTCRQTEAGAANQFGRAAQVMHASRRRQLQHVATHRHTQTDTDTRTDTDTSKPPAEAAETWLTCGEADVSRSPDQSESCDSDRAQKGQGDVDLLVREPALAREAVKGGFHKSKPWLCVHLHPDSRLSFLVRNYSMEQCHQALFGLCTQPQHA